jgi:DNA-cytosine methyltransferase
VSTTDTQKIISFDEEIILVDKGNKDLEDIWANIEDKSKNLELSLNTDLKRNTGSYYTGLELAKYMVDELFENAGENFIKTLKYKTFLEPCVGTGNFVFAFLRKVYECNYTQSEVQQILHNIYVCDTNKEALQLYENLLKRFVYILWKIKLENNYFDEHIGGGLLYDVTQDIPSFISLEEIFSPEIVNRGFDIIITNPPYKNLKAEKNNYTSSQHYDHEKERYALISKDVKKRFKHSNDGVLNLYKLFVEKFLVEYTKESAYLSLLVPSTILSDKTCEKLRTYILKTHRLSHINIIRENNPFINAQQSLCTMLIEKNKATTTINIVPDFCKEPSQKSNLFIDDAFNSVTGNAIFSLPSKEYEILKKIRVFPTVKDLYFVVNMRGELDLTADSNYITTNKTLFPLLRGKNVGYFKLSSDPTDFVNNLFLEKTNKNIYVEKPRIICQQVVNIHKERRVTFSYIDRGYVLGNSCNFIAVKENKYNIDLYTLLGLFNSPIINWFFKLTSTNNHVNNYEIDSFPIPVGSPYLKKISELTKEYLNSQNNELLELIYNLSYACYGISSENSTGSKKEIINDNVRSLYLSLKEIIPNISIESSQLLLDSGASIDTILTEIGLVIDELSKKICEHIIKKHQKIKRREILNHTSFKLSNLDLEMVRAVPQGGNWKDIPQETINKSKRLIRIKETGGRTTLYGRIDYTKPAYTITTYFNRPGNGTYIHPIHNRVISVREAARLQSFKDDYFFYGNKTELLKQVGNAVPPILAYQIGKSIINKTGCKTSLDLFCGAGGLTLGFKEAGVSTILGVDIDKSACITFKANNPEIEILCDDITKENVKKRIIDTSLQNNVDIVCGGPPCQGFSHAGKRFIDDPRNEMFKHFIEVVAGINPKVVIMENVEGMLTFQKGEVYRQIIDLFSSLGYNTEGRILYAHKYAVPQKRKRVIIMCVRNDMNIGASDLFQPEISGNEDNQIPAYDAISDFEKIPCSEDAKYYDDSPLSNFAEEMMGYRKFGYFVDNQSHQKSKACTYEKLSFF